MKLCELLKEIPKNWIHGSHEVEISSLAYDSRKCTRGAVFFAIGGLLADGNAYIQQALDRGAVAVVSENREILDSLSHQEGVTGVHVTHVRRVMSAAASRFYGDPSQKIKVIGITGTNGKSTTAFLLKELLESQGHRTGLIGTLGNFFEDWQADATHTTPESVELQFMLKEMADRGGAYCIMEVSSHALSLNRVEHVRFQGSIFTNLSQDHLDFHETMEDYYLAKEKLFRYNQAYAIVNTDDPYGRRIHSLLKQSTARAIGFGVDHPREFHLQIHNLADEGSDFALIGSAGSGSKETLNVTTNQAGIFNVYNLSCAILAGVMEGLDVQQMVESAKNLTGVKGRMERVPNEKGITILIDFAHTPDGLENVLKTLKKTATGRIITVFGCGGDRDRKKRPIMGQIAGQWSDHVVVTSDNPRNEDPMKIIEEILKGLDGFHEKSQAIADRRKAIEKAISIAEQGDVVLIAGKGHEMTQIIQGIYHPFDERVIVKEILESL